MSSDSRIFSLALVAILGFMGSSSVFSAERQVSVEGSCTREVTTDRGSIVLTAEITNDDLKAAAKLATEAYQRTRESIQRLNLEHVELRTVEYSVQAVQEWEKGKAIHKGYRARMGLLVATSQVQRLGEVIAIAAREGLKDVGQLTTFLSDAKREQERLDCLKSAAENARSRAERLAKSLGATLGEVLSIHEGAVHEPAPGPWMTMGAESAARSKQLMAPPPVEPGQQKISVVVRVTFALK